MALLINQWVHKMYKIAMEYLNSFFEPTEPNHFSKNTKFFQNTSTSVNYGFVC